MISVEEGIELVTRIGAASNGLAVASVARGDGSVHASLVNAGVLAHPVTGVPVAGFVVRANARKLALIRTTGTATVTFRNGWEWVSLEGSAEAAGPEDELAGFDRADVAGLLRDIFRAAGGTHDDWDEFDRVMAAEARTAVLVTPRRALTN